MMAAAALVAPPPAAQFRSGVEVVHVDVLVKRGGRPVSGLTADNFELFDSGVRQRIQSVDAGSLPLNIMLALDVSSSTAGRPLRDLKEAAHAVVSLLRAGDRMALLTFSQHAQLRASWTADIGRLRRAIDMTAAEGMTALRDAMFAAMTQREGVTGRMLLIVFSDGHDTASWLSARDIVNAVGRTDVAIHAVQTAPVPSAAPAILRRELLSYPQLNEAFLLPVLATESGGAVISVTDSRQVRAAFLGIVEDFRSGYVLTFSPEGVPRDGWHPLDVRLRGVRGDVRARPGYVRR
jgi:VWFA-related protein